MLYLHCIFMILFVCLFVVLLYRCCGGVFCPVQDSSVRRADIAAAILSPSAVMSHIPSCCHRDSGRTLQQFSFIYLSDCQSSHPSLHIFPSDLVLISHAHCLINYFVVLSFICSSSSFPTKSSFIPACRISTGITKVCV